MYLNLDLDKNLNNLLKSIYSSSEKIYSFNDNYSLYEGLIPNNYNKKIPLIIDGIINTIYDNYTIMGIFLNIDTYMKNKVTNPNNVQNGLKGLIAKSSDINYVKTINTYLFSGKPPNPNPENLKILPNKNISCSDIKDQFNNTFIINYLKYISDLSTFNTNGLTTPVPKGYFIDLRLPGVAGEYATFLELYIMKCT